MTIFIRVFMLVLLLNGMGACYKAQKIPANGGTLTYSAHCYGIDLKKGGDGYFHVSVQRVTGDPRNVEIDCNFADLPAGINISVDSFICRLNYDTSFVVHVSNSIDTGNHFANLQVRTALYGTQDYPFKFHVSPN